MIERNPRCQACGQPILASPEALRLAGYICARAAHHFGVELGTILGLTRTKRACMARQGAMWVLRTRFGWSLQRIGHLFERNHTTVINALRRVDCWEAPQRLALSAALEDGAPANNAARNSRPS